MESVPALLNDYPDTLWDLDNIHEVADLFALQLMQEVNLLNGHVLFRIGHELSNVLMVVRCIKQWNRIFLCLILKDWLRVHLVNLSWPSDGLPTLLESLRNTLGNLLFTLLLYRLTLFAISHFALVNTLLILVK